jgi:uncharacterized DUF497 family protein
MYDWDPSKAKANIAKHGVSFETAIGIFDGLVLSYQDNRHDYGEVREISIGAAGGVAILTVVHTDRAGIRRIISARPATRRERVRYETEIQQRAQS